MIDIEYVSWGSVMAIKIKKILFLLILSFLYSCGGGGTSPTPEPEGGPDGDSQPVINTAPVANAGADQDVIFGQSVTLDAGLSTDEDGDALTYTWTQSKSDTHLNK